MGKLTGFIIREEINKYKMKKLNFFLLGISLIVIASAIASAQAAASTSTSVQRQSCNLAVTLLNQDPYPAVPGEYVKVVFQVSGLEDPNCNGAKFRLVPTYPFSLDAEDEVKEMNGNTYITGYKKTWMVGYKLRVNKDAVNGENYIETRYSSKTSGEDSYISKTLNITIEDTRTSFDAVVQEFTGSEISIALANVGENMANAIISRIPDQDGYTVTGTNGQMVGNLESGDYTIVGYEITQKRNDAKSQLKFQIDYTDSIGERRTVILNLTVGNIASTNSNFTAGGFSGRPSNGTATGTTGITNWIITNWIASTVIAVIVVIILWILFKNKEKIFGKNNKNHGNTPDWIKNEKQNKKS
jgi:hypothetical protein